MSRPSNSSNKLRLGVSSGAFYPGLASEDVPSAAMALGLPDIEVMFQTVGEYRDPVIRQLRVNAHDAGCRVGSIHLWSELHQVLSPYRRRVEEGRALFDRAIAAAVELGADVMVWHGPNSLDVEPPGAWDRLATLIIEIGAACGEAGISLAMENVSRAVLPGAREVARLARRLDEAGPCARVGFTFDPFQAAEAGANPFMILAAMGDRVVNVHVSDFREHAPDLRHLPPGQGDLPWPALIRAIAATYEGPLILECALGEQPVETLRDTRALLDPLLNAPLASGDSCAGDAPPGLVAGIALFNERQFYECHEEIEHEWHAERGEIRRLYQGILQIGVGFHHAVNANQRGAILLLGDGIAKTARFVPDCLGIATGRLVRESQACLDTIAALGPEDIGNFDPGTIPVISQAGRVDEPFSGDLAVPSQQENVSG